MGLFGSLFGGGKKQNYGELIPNPPRFSLAQGSQDRYRGGIDQLINVFQNRSQGNDIFDALKYIYEPQANELRRSYGIDTDPGDIYSQRTGSLPQTLASLNKRGLLDTGTSGIIEGQLRSNLNNELGRSYGSAKTMQRQDIDNALSMLQQLFPERFQAENIQSQIDYDNAMNDYNATLQRNQATAGQQQMRAANKAGAWDSALGLGMNFLTGGFSGGGGFNPSAGFGNLTGTYNPYQNQMFPQRNTTGNGISDVGSTAPSSNFLRRKINSYYKGGGY